MILNNFADFKNNEARRMRLHQLSSDPSLGTGDAGRVWFDTTNNVIKGWTGTATTKLGNIIESISVTGAIKATAPDAAKNVALSIDAASSGGPGTQSVAHFNLLAGATSANTASALVQRDSSGNFAAGTISASLNGAVTLLADPTSALQAVTKQYADAISAAAEKTANKSVSGTLVANGYIGADAAGRIDPAMLYGAGSGTYGVIRLAGDLGGTSTAPTVPALAQKAPLASPTFTGTVTLPGDPTANLHAATKQYVDNIATGLDTKASVVYATTAALPANTYANGSSGVGATLTASANGALAVDGQTPAVGARILVKNEATAANNGIYVVTQVGSGSAPYILTRATDADTSAEVSGGMFTFVEAGSTNQTTSWVLAGTGAWTIGTTAQNFSQFGGGSTYTNGNGLGLAGNVFSVVGTANRIAVSASGVDISANYVGQTSITTLGTIATGTWQGTAVGVGYGGTGATTAAAARSNLGAAGSQTVQVPAIAAGGNVQIANPLGTANCIAQLINNTTNDVEWFDVNITASNITITNGAVAVAANAYRLVVVG